MSDRVDDGRAAGSGGRRLWTEARKRKIVREVEGGVSRRAVTERYRITRGLLAKWVERYGSRSRAASAQLLPVQLVGEARGTGAWPGEASGGIGVELPGGIRLRVEHGVEGGSLRLVLDVPGGWR